ncbi:MAG TPA: hypothetical protein VMM77_10965, partial [Gemmatimonadaceae bacterium]|nr:hypothetical protein [Gemmatimonadaceae bacterium]
AGDAWLIYSGRTMKAAFFALLLCVAAVPFVVAQSFDAELAQRLGADERGMKTYILCILKTGPRDTAIQGEERKQIFAGHFANIKQLADEGKLAAAGPFGRNDKAWRGLYLCKNMATIAGPAE